MHGFLHFELCHTPHTHYTSWSVEKQICNLHICLYRDDTIQTELCGNYLQWLINGRDETHHSEWWSTQTADKTEGDTHDDGTVPIWPPRSSRRYYSLRLDDDCGHWWRLWERRVCARYIVLGFINVPRIGRWPFHCELGYSAWLRLWDMRMCAGLGFTDVARIQRWPLHCELGCSGGWRVCVHISQHYLGHCTWNMGTVIELSYPHSIRFWAWSNDWATSCKALYT